MNSNEYENLLAQLEKLRRHSRAGSFKTRERYYEAYSRFLRYLAMEYKLQRLANISPKHLKGYVRYLQKNGKASATIKTDLSAIRFWHDQIPNARYKLPENAELDLERRKFGDKKRAWTQNEYEKLVRIARLSGRDDYAACFTLDWEIGLRIHEIFRIDTAIARDAVKKGVITIKGKGGKVRTVPLSDMAAQVLDETVKKTPPGQKLFVPPGKKTHEAIKEIQMFILEHRDEIQEANRETPLTMHGGRHAYAARLYEQLVAEGRSEDKAMKMVSERLGHERKEVTKIYLA